MVKEKQKRQRRISTVDAYAFPDFDVIKLDAPNYQSLIGSALNYANYVFELDDLKKFTIEYDRAYTYKGVPALEFLHIGKLCWLLNNGAELSETAVKELNDRLRALEERYHVESEVKPIYIPSAKEKLTNDILGQLEEFLDKAIYGKVEYRQEFGSMVKVAGEFDVGKVKAYFQQQYDEIMNIENVEYFEGWKASERKHIAEVFQFIIEQLDQYAQIEKPKKPKAIRTPRKINPSKMVKKMKYLRDFKELEIKSIHPEKIVFSKVLFAYNTKTRKLQRYVAATDKGLLVKGSTILAFDEKLSIAKTLRKPKEVLDKLQAAGKVEQRTFMDTINAVGSPLTGRINSDTIIFKVY